jgi:hypothetical protein
MNCFNNNIFDINEYKNIIVGIKNEFKNIYSYFNLNFINGSEILNVLIYILVELIKLFL